jgi:hypothetical protein
VKTEHELKLKVERGRVLGSCTCGGWYRYTEDDGHGQKRLAEKFVDHKREMRRR